MAEQQEHDELDDITEEDAKRLLEGAKSDDKDDDADPAGSDQLGDAGKKALDSIKEQRRAAREERDRARKEAEELRQKLRGFEDKDKSETQRLQEQLEHYKNEASQASSSLRRREVAEEHAPEHATPAQIRAVAKRLHGDSDEALKADAEELFALIAPEPTKAPVAGKPKERLQSRPSGGGDPDDGPDETDPKKLAALIPRAR